MHRCMNYCQVYVSVLAWSGLVLVSALPASLQYGASGVGGWVLKRLEAKVQAKMGHAALQTPSDGVWSSPTPHSPHPKPLASSPFPIPLCPLSAAGDSRCAQEGWHEHAIPSLPSLPQLPHPNAPHCIPSQFWLN